MLLKPQPIFEAVEAIWPERAAGYALAQRHRTQRRVFFRPAVERAEDATVDLDEVSQFFSDLAR